MADIESTNVVTPQAVREYLNQIKEIKDKNSK
jgi:FtsZ-interacting cell division protein ZipA